MDVHDRETRRQTVLDALKALTEGFEGRHGSVVSIALDREQLASLDQWISAQPAPQPTREQAVTRLVNAALCARSLMAQEFRDGPPTLDATLVERCLSALRS